MSEKDTVVYEHGKPEKKRIGSELLTFILLDDMSITLKEIEKATKKDEFEGRLDPRTLSATENVSFIDLRQEDPHIPWVTAHFRNDGNTTIPPSPKDAYVSINNPYEWNKLEDGEEMSVSFAKADRRIELVYYKCDAGGTASIRATGKY